jgi:hypothetical protein
MRHDVSNGQLGECEYQWRAYLIPNVDIVLERVGALGFCAVVRHEDDVTAILFGRRRHGDVGRCGDVK